MCVDDQTDPDGSYFAGCVAAIAIGALVATIVGGLIALGLTGR